MKWLPFFFALFISLNACQKPSLPASNTPTTPVVHPLPEPELNIKGEFNISGDGGALIIINNEAISYLDSFGSIVMLITGEKKHAYKGQVIESSGIWKDIYELNSTLWTIIKPGFFAGFTKDEWNQEEIQFAFASDEVRSLSEVQSISVENPPLFK